MEHENLTRLTIGLAMKVHSTLGSGFLESVYQNALAYELREAGVEVACEQKIEVFYRGVEVGHFVADMLIENCVIVENKAVQALVVTHEVQLVNYLTATGIDIGLLFNFGASRLQYRRKNRIYRPTKTQED